MDGCHVTIALDFQQGLIQQRTLEFCVSSPPDKLSPSRTTPLPALQALRAVAASIVVFHHFALIYKDTHNSHIQASGFGSLGRCGVDIFFVISGFIMAYTTRRAVGIDATWNFLSHRVKRILPLYWLWSGCLFFLWAVHAVHLGHFSKKFLFLSFLLVPVSNGKTYYPLLSQGWTLEFEMLFYLVFAATITFGVKRFRLLGILLAAFSALAFIGILLPECGIRFLLTNSITLEFLFGVFVCEILLESKGHLSLRVSYASLATGVFGLLLTLFVRGELDPLRFFWFGVPSAFLVFGAAALGTRPVPRILTYLGDASYSIYLVHYFFASAFASALTHVHVLSRIPPDAVIIVLGSIAIVISAKTYDWVERPIIKVTKGRKPLAPGAMHDSQSPQTAT